LGNQLSHKSSTNMAIVANLLEAIGIGSLLPLPGFLVLVVGDVATSLFFHRKHASFGDSGAERVLPRTISPSRAFRWSDALATHLGLCFAFVAMIIFSVVLIDRVADVLFGITALVSMAANARTFWRL
jgi:hypothetical protein